MGQAEGSLKEPDEELILAFSKFLRKRTDMRKEKGSVSRNKLSICEEKRRGAWLITSLALGKEQWHCLKEGDAEGKSDNVLDR